MKIPAKKSLGQHFLLNPSTIDKILEKAGVKPTDRILEIGPGPGIMIGKLISRVSEVIAVEKDRRFFEKLREKFSGKKNVALIEGDILDLEIPKILSPGTAKWKVVANLPYNIATEVIFHLLEFNSLFDSFYLMVQREVAERLTAKPGSKDYGILSVFSQLFSENRIVMRLPPGAFTPPPKVHSALVEFCVSENCRFSIHDLPTFETVVRAAFGQRRKMVSNALQHGFPNLAPEAIRATLIANGFSPSLRAERIPIDGFVKIANHLRTGKG